MPEEKVERAKLIPKPNCLYLENGNHKFNIVGHFVFSGWGKSLKLSSWKLISKFQGRAVVLPCCILDSPLPVDRHHDLYYYDAFMSL